VLWEWDFDDFVQDAWGESVEEEPDGFLVANYVAGLAYQVFKVWYVLVHVGEAHLALVKLQSGSLLRLGICKMIIEFLDEGGPDFWYVVIDWV
jgi:hypothetical protein